MKFIQRMKERQVELEKIYEELHDSGAKLKRLLNAANTSMSLPLNIKNNLQRDAINHLQKAADWGSKYTQLSWFETIVYSDKLRKNIRAIRRQSESISSLAHQLLVKY